MRRNLYIILTVVGFFIVWELIVKLFSIPEYILPAPFNVLLVIINNFSFLCYHSAITIIEIILGFLLGFAVAFSITVLSHYSKYVNEVVHPILVVLQVVPKIALAPLFLIWLGYGLIPKIIITALVCLFPIAINFKKGIDSVDQQFIDILRSVGATKTQILKEILLPSSIPLLFSGLKIGMALAVVGAITGEYVGATKGAGYLLEYYATMVDTPELFSALFMIIIIGLALYLLIVFLEKKIIFWQKKSIFE